MTKVVELHHRVTRAATAPAYVRFVSAATLAASIDVAAVEEHLARYAVSCPLCRAVDRMGVAQHLCGIEAADGADDSISVVLVVCRRCGYLMPLAADRVVAPSALVAA